MKKKIMTALTVLGLLSAAIIFIAQTWYPTNQATVAWDAVPPIATGDTMKYQVWTKMGSSGTPAKVGGEITATSMTITFTVEGRYFVGVETIRYPQGETVGTRSNRIAWSDISTDCAAAGPFGIVYFVPPPEPDNLRRAG